MKREKRPAGNAKLARRKRRAATAKVSIREPGLYYLSASRIGEVLGLGAAQVRRLIRTRWLSLSNRGEPVATAAAPGNRGLYFYGQAVGDGAATGTPQDRRDDIYTLENVYLLRRGRGLPMGIVDGGRPAAVLGRHFRETVVAEGNRYTLTHLFDDPDGDYWMWDFRFGGLPLPDCDTVEPGMPATSASIRCRARRCRPWGRRCHIDGAPAWRNADRCRDRSSGECQLEWPAAR